MTTMTNKTTHTNIWIGYGPVAQSAKAVYDWSDTMVDMLVNFGNIACIIAIIPASWVF
jgi:hypothetical protein